MLLGCYRGCMSPRSGIRRGEIPRVRVLQQLGHKECIGRRRKRLQRQSKISLDSEGKPKPSLRNGG